MDDLSEKIGALLADPESMQNLSELAAMLGKPDAPQEPQTSAPDLAKLMAVGQALSQSGPDARADLIRALKPYLSAERAERADKAVKLLRLWQTVSMLRESGALNDIL